MALITFSTEHLDYLQRTNFVPAALTTDLSRCSVPPSLRRLYRVDGIGNPDKSAFQAPEHPIQEEEDTSISQAGQSYRLLSEDVLIGMHGCKAPIVFLVWGDSGEVAIHFGTWSANKENAASAKLDQRKMVLKTILSSLYPAIDLADGEAKLMAKPPLAGFVLGIPTAKPPHRGDNALPIDRLIRAMYKTKWAILVLAEPIDERFIYNHRNCIINEIRFVESSAREEGTPSPLAEYYRKLLHIELKRLTHGQAVGTWRTGVYLLGDSTSYHCLKSLWRGIFSGERSLLEPVRVLDCADAGELAVNWTLPETPGPDQPPNCQYQHPFLYQTLLSSSELAAYMHLPQVETSGFSVKLVPEFDVMPQKDTGSQPVSLGYVIERTNDTNISYLLSSDTFKRHALITGVTGSGKTNTVFHILLQLWGNHRIPFLTLEPAKTEYRALVKQERIGSDIRIFTLGDEQVSPLRINPFEVEPGVSVSTHIDLLKSVFNASFGMWDPLPQVLERAIHEIYHDCGWDPVRGINLRLSMESNHTPHIPEAYPTLTALYEKVEEIVDTLGYEDRITGNIKSALMTRLNSLRIGGKGVMLDVQCSIPITELLEKPTIIELEQIGDDDEKAFIMGLLLIKIYEHLRANSSTEGTHLKHVIVVEEAHRLLANVLHSGNQEQSNVRGKAVEAFVNMLSEVRAYGEGFLVAEQIPIKLAPDVIKNTNLKVAHRIVAGDDRKLLGDAMNMKEQKNALLATLETGQAAIFAEGDDRPILIRVPYRKIKVPPEMQTKKGSDAVVTTHMEWFKKQSHIAPFFFPFSACADFCREPFGCCTDGKDIAHNRDLQERMSAFVLSVLFGKGAPSDRFAQLRDHIQSRLPHGISNEHAVKCTILNAARWYFSYFGRRHNWPYHEVKELNRILDIIINRLMTIESDLITSADDEINGHRSQFLKLYLSVCKGVQRPFPDCQHICPRQECVSRFHVERLLKDKNLATSFNQGMAEAADQEGWENMEAMERVIVRLGGNELPRPVNRSLALCYGLQQMTFGLDLQEKIRTQAINKLIQEFDIREKAYEMQHPGGDANADC